MGCIFALALLAATIAVGMWTAFSLRYGPVVATEGFSVRKPERLKMSDLKLPPREPRVAGERAARDEGGRGGEGRRDKRRRAVKPPAP